MISASQSIQLTKDTMDTMNSTLARKLLQTIVDADYSLCIRSTELMYLWGGNIYSLWTLDIVHRGAVY